MKRILIGIDGSAASAIALEWAAHLAAAAGADVTAVTVFDPSISKGEDEPITHATLAARLEGEWTAPVRGFHVACSSRVVDGEPRAALADAAVADDAELVVVGTSGSGGFRGLGLGGVAHYLAHHLPRPLAAVPSSAALDSHGPVVVGIDGSDGSTASATWAAELAEQLGTGVVAVCCYDPLADSYPHPEANWQYPGVAAVEAQAGAIASSFTGTKVELRILGAEPVEGLNQVAAAVDARMIVVARRNRGSLGGLLLGRVPARLLHNARRPVVIVPR